MTDQHPPLPKGFHRWEPRPRGWTSDKPVKYAFRHHQLPNPVWQEMPDLAIPLASRHCDYLEAVKDAPEDRCPSCDGTGDVHRPDGEYLGQCHCRTDTRSMPHASEWVEPDTDPEDTRVVEITEAILTALRDRHAKLPACAFSLIAPIIRKAITQ